MFIPFTNWQPDADPVAPNLLVDPTKNIVPTDRGYKGANSFLDVIGQTSLSGTAVGMWYARRTDGNNLLFGGTPTNIYVRSGGAWTADVAAAVTVSAVSRWQFAQWGNLTFAGALETQPLISDTTTFTSIAAMPRYAIIDSINEFVMIGNVSVSVTYSDGYGAMMVTPGDYQDRWWCSGVSNPLTWQPNVATQCTSGRLTDVAGKFTAGRALGDRFVFYKQRAIYVGTYTTVPFIWEWALVSNEIGTFGQQCVVPVGSAHFFVGTDDFYVFDGQQARSIGQGMRRWFFVNLDKKYADLIWGVHDQYNHLVYWWYPSANSNGVLDSFVVYHYQTGRWGRGMSTMKAASAFFVDALTWDQLWVGYTFDTVPNTTFDAAVFQAESYIPVFFTGSNKLATLDGPQLNGIIKTTFGGDDTRASLLRRVRARWITTPTTAELTPFRLMRQGESPQASTNPKTMYNARWDFTQNARWHTVQIDTTGNWETTGIDAEVYSRGRE